MLRSLTAGAVLLALISISTACGSAPRGAVTVGDAVFAVEIARTPQERARGLAERDSLPGSSGMLFVFESGRAPAFWMKGMRFPLDFIWIGQDCSVVDVLRDVPAPPPDTPDSEIARVRTDAEAVYIVVVNAGQLQEHGIEVGDAVRFSGLALEAAGACT